MDERLQKYLARCGIASRRRSEEMIVAGKVMVDGEPITQLGSRVDPDTQVVEVDGQRVRPSSIGYFAVHKPRGVVCSNHDPAGRPLAVNLVPHKGMRLFPIGRLDEDSEGLLLLTNDGELAQRIAHPSYEVPKKYLITVKGSPDGEALEKLRKGIWLAEGKTSPASVQVLRKTRERTQLLLTIREGKKRHLRRILARVELPVQRLIRVQVGPIRLGTLKKGSWRPLSAEEIRSLREGRNQPIERRRGKPLRPSAKRPPKAAKVRAAPGARRGKDRSA